MCLIIAKPAGTAVQGELVNQSIRDNPHGWGIMYAKDGEIIIDKGMADADYITAVNALPLEQEAFIHSRIRTKGGVATYNNHPFRLSEHFALMHNGSLGIDIKFEEMSDTWHFAHQILAPMLARRPELFLDKQFETLLSAAVGIGNKLVILRSDGASMIVNKHKGENWGGLWLSNDRSLWGSWWDAPGSLTGFRARRANYVYDNSGFTHEERSQEYYENLWDKHKNNFVIH